MIPSCHRTCLNAALGLLERRDHGSVELRRKLVQRGYAPEQIAFALAECERMHYLDDAKFCELFVLQQRRKGYGLFRISQKLKEKGLPGVHIEESLRRNCDEMNQIEDCRRAMAKKLNSWPLADHGARTKRLYRFLLSRGFSSTTIGQVLNESL